MTNRDLKRMETRNRLMQTAIELFSERGFVSTGTLNITRAAGVSHGALFVHFPTREDLVCAAIEEVGSQIAAHLHKLAAKKASVREVLGAHVRGLIEFENFYAHLVAEGPFLPPIARSTLIGIQSAVSFHLAEVAQQEIDQGKVKTISIPLFFNTWIGLLHHYLQNRDLFAPKRSVLKKHGKCLLDHMMELITP